MALRYIFTSQLYLPTEVLNLDPQLTFFFCLFVVSKSSTTIFQWLYEASIIFVRAATKLGDLWISCFIRLIDHVPLHIFEKILCIQANSNSSGHQGISTSSKLPTSHKEIWFLSHLYLAFIEHNNCSSYIAREYLDTTGARFP